MTTPRKPRAFVPPRIGTPRTDAETLGPQIGAISAKLGEPFMPHQQYIADVAYELTGDGRLKYDEIVLSIMRQSGKTSFVRAKSVWRCTTGQKFFGQDQVSVYTAQKRQDARKRLQRDFVPRIRKASMFREVKDTRSLPLTSTDWKVSMNNGQEHILFGPSSYLQIETPNREAGHGDTVDDATIDEAFAHRNDELEQGLEPTMLTRKGKQLWVVSTAGDDQSFYLWPKIRDGRAMIERGVETSTAFFEWSLPDDADIDDEDAWWEFMPALGRTIDVVTLRRGLEKARRRTDEDGEDMFRRANCNQWVRIPIMSDDDQPRVIDRPTWSALADGHARIVGDLALGVDMSPAHRTVYLSVAGATGDGRHLVEVVHQQTSLMGLEDRITEALQRFAPVAVAWDDGTCRELAPSIRRAVGDQAKEVCKALTGREWSAACGGFVTAVKDGRLTHLDQDWLTFGVEGATKKHRGDSWVWDRLTSSSDIAGLCAATAALRAIESYTPSESDEFYVY